MRKLWWASLIVLLLGNAVDAVASYATVCTYGVEEEGGILALLLLEAMDPFTLFILVGLSLKAIFGVLVWYFFVVIESRWVGIRLSTFVGFLYGIYFAAAGTGLLTLAIVGPLLLFFPPEEVLVWLESPVTPPFAHAVSVVLLVLAVAVAWVYLLMAERGRYRRSGS